MANLAQIVGTCLKSPELKAKLIADPKATLAEHGLKVPAGITVKVVENTASVLHLVLPNTTASGQLSDEELAAAAGGWGDPVRETGYSFCDPC